MTKLKDRKSAPPKFETSAQYRGTPICVELRQGFMAIWLKGCPTTRTTLDFEVAFEAAQKVAAREAGIKI